MSNTQLYTTLMGITGYYLGGITGVVVVVSLFQDSWYAVLIQIASQVGQIQHNVRGKMVHNQREGETGLQRQAKI